MDADRQQRSALEGLQKQAMEATQANDEVRRQAMEKTQAAYERDLHHGELEKQLKAARSQADDALTSLSKERQQQQRLREEQKSLQTRFAKLEHASESGSINEVLETELAELHKALRCRACNQRRKVGGHTEMPASRRPPLHTPPRCG